MHASVQQLIEDNVTVLRQGRELIDTLSAATYTEGQAPLGLSGVGPHVRHVSDFYLRFLGAFDGSPAAGTPRRIDYDARDRNPLTETDRGHAQDVLARIIVGLRRLAERADELDGLPLEVRSDDSPWVSSNLSRELLSLLGHTVHHHALMAVVVRAGGGATPRDIGVAPSTLRHWAEQRPAADPPVGACAR